jgi:lipid-A-disaccharide synthase
MFLIAGEESGDALGGALMAELKQRAGSIVFAGVGGKAMMDQGLGRSLFPMEEIALHGLAEVATRLPALLRRIGETTRAVLAARPDVLVAIDCPAFSLRVAKRVRKADPRIAIVDYVSPTVWAYFPHRAPAMARYVDRLLAILPFEPEVHRRLGGPPTTYVGHPLVARLPELTPARDERKPLGGGPPTLLVLPGSRRFEVSRLMQPFGETVKRIVDDYGPVEVVLPAVARMAEEVRERAAAWPLAPKIVEGEAAKLAAFRSAHAALAASGTVTLELALAGVPTVVAYRLDPLVRPLKRFLQAKSIVLPNLIVEERAVPEFLDGESSPATLAEAVIPLLRDGPERAAQIAAFDRVRRLMAVGEKSPAALAAEAVLATVGARQA